MIGDSICFVGIVGVDATTMIKRSWRRKKSIECVRVVILHVCYLTPFFFSIHRHQDEPRTFILDCYQLNHWIEVAILALHDPINITRDPTAIEIARLCLNLFTIHVAVPRTGVKGQKALEWFKALRGFVIRPYSVWHLVAV